MWRQITSLSLIGALTLHMLFTCCPHLEFEDSPAGSQIVLKEAHDCDHHEHCLSILSATIASPTNALPPQRISSLGFSVKSVALEEIPALRRSMLQIWTI